MNINEIDKNFYVPQQIGVEGMKFVSAENEPFRIYGVFRENDKFCRLPKDVAKSVSEGVYGLCANTAGGRVRFVTDSRYIAIAAIFGNVGKMPHFALSGSIGFDLYDGNKYVKTFMPPFNVTNKYESVVDLETSQKRVITINFPLYSEVKEFYIGVLEQSTIEKAPDYKNTKPIVFYGSSITQGGCASRPGRSYQSIISRRFDYDYVNLGFSGNAKGEDNIAQYIKNLDMSLFVYDYDYNAPSVEHLEKTHQKMFETIRSANPKLPIIIMSRPKFYLSPEEVRRREIIENTYNTALSKGDKNVYFISGEKLTELCGNEGTVDNCHPTDFGFESMAKAVGDVIEKIDIT